MPTHFVVTNQHGDNRGDEAALRGLVLALHRSAPDSRITVVHQFASEESAIELPGVAYLPLKLSLLEGLRLVAWTLLAACRIPVDALLGAGGRQLVEAYRDADVVISAPGGPYFGDIYADHEVVHWFYVWLAAVIGRPLALYQPSAGPFDNRLLRPIRKWGYGLFDEVSVRETESADHIEALTGHRPHLGSDSAFHEHIDAADLSDPDLRWWLGDPPERLVAATFRRPAGDASSHDRAVVDALVRVGQGGTRIVLLPQLHGRRRDKPYLDGLGKAATDRGADVVVAPDTLDSTQQRSLVAASTFVLAGRYHPLVFAVAAGRPAVVVPYEHKASSFAEAAGLDAYVVPLDALGDGRLIEAIERLESDLPAATEIVLANRDELARAAAGTTERVMELVVPKEAAA